MTGTGASTPRNWRHYSAAALASAVVPAVFLQATRLANWQVEHPVPVPGDDSPGGGNLGSVLAVPLFGFALLLSLVLPALWGTAAVRSATGRTPGVLPEITATLQGVALLVALGAAAFLPRTWLWAPALVAAELLAVAIARNPRRIARSGC
ncbi:hypothetical protein [Kitasatospora sp. NPDC088134]|uniref:hypothetical protein n=1 Tax=Kitasatospora sp. NPDC088134 TaxID=3364071 RepID=UPI0038222EAF